VIEKINKIQKLGIFEDYLTNNNLEKFTKFNLIYGWNGSGKTTFSELFKAFKSGKLEEFPDLKYTITCSDGSYPNTREYNKNNIHVFNQKYVADNVDVVSGNIKPIFILGKVNLDLSKIIQKDEKELSDRKEVLAIKNQELIKKRKGKDKIFTDVARIISANTGYKINASPASLTTHFMGYKLLRTITGNQKFSHPKANSRTWPDIDNEVRIRSRLRKDIIKLHNSEYLRDLLPFFDFNKLERDTHQWINKGRPGGGLFLTSLLTIDNMMNEIS